MAAKPRKGGGATKGKPGKIRSQAEGQPYGQGVRVTWETSAQDRTYTPPKKGAK